MAEKHDGASVHRETCYVHMSTVKLDFGLNIQDEEKHFQGHNSIIFYLFLPF